MGTDLRIEILKNEFEAKGPEQVKVDLTQGVYGSNDSSDAQLARVFIAECEAKEERAFREGESNRSAKTVDLHEDTNEIARTANRRATAALFISLLAVIVSVVNVIL